MRVALSSALDHRWLVPALLCLGAALVGVAPSADGDIWWHLAAGREMVTTHRWLFSDPFSVSAQGRPWLDVHWLFQVAVYAIHGRLGLAGLVWAKCLLLSASTLLLLGALPARRGDWARWVLVPLLIAALFAARGLLLVRPVIATLFFLALFLRQLECFRRDGRWQHLVTLPIAQVVWVNVQGLSALGPAVISVYALSAAGSRFMRRWRLAPFEPEAPRPKRARRELGALLVVSFGCVAASALTPFGVAGLLLPARLLARLLPGASNVHARAVAENVPPFVLERMTGEFWHLKWFLLALALAFVCGGRRIRASQLLLVVGFGLLALISNRNVLLFYWVATPIAATRIGRALAVWSARGRSQARTRLVLFGAIAPTLLGILAISGVAAAREPTLDRPTPFRMPIESVERLSRLPGGDVFCADHQSGYLIWNLYPRFRPYLDTRLILRSAREFEEYLALAEFPERFATFQAHHRFSYVLLPVAYPDRYLGLIATLYASREWTLIFSDGSEVLFARRDLAAQPVDLGDDASSEQITERVEARYGAGSALSLAARLQLATLQVAVGEFAQAERTLSSLTSLDAEALRARSRLGAGDLGGARKLAERLLRIAPRDPSNLDLMAQIALRSGEPNEGLAYVRRALLRDPFDDEANHLLATLEKSQ